LNKAALGAERWWLINPAVGTLLERESSIPLPCKVAALEEQRSDRARIINIGAVNFIVRGGGVILRDGVANVNAGNEAGRHLAVIAIVLCFFALP